MASNEHFAKLKKDELHKTGADSGCLWRSCGRSKHKYRENGYEKLKEGKFKKYYDHDFTVPNSAARKRADAVITGTYYGDKKNKDPRHNKSLWYRKSNGNFQSGKKPWKNNAHHILPCATLRNAFDGLNEYEILLMAKYNLNAGENVVYLPKKTLDGKMMQMVTHPGSHPAYNDKVEALVHKKVKPKIKKAADSKSKGHGPLEEKDVPKVKETIDKETEKIMMDILKHGKVAPGITINEFDPK